VVSKRAAEPSEIVITDGSGAFGVLQDAVAATEAAGRFAVLFAGTVTAATQAVFARFTDSVIVAFRRLASSVTEAVGVVAVGQAIAIVVDVVVAAQCLTVGRCATIPGAAAGRFAIVAYQIATVRCGSAVFLAYQAVFQTTADVIATTGLALRHTAALKPVCGATSIFAGRVQSTAIAIPWITVLPAGAILGAAETVFAVGRFTNTVATGGRVAQYTVTGAVCTTLQCIANAVVVAVAENALVDQLITTHVRAGIAAVDAIAVNTGFDAIAE
jgi:hypothetical protein